MKTEIIEFTIPNWALSYLINADASGLSDEDEVKLKKFEEETFKAYGNSSFSLPKDSELNLGFKPHNDIDSLGSDCSKLLLLVKIYKVYKVGRKNGMSGRRQLLGKGLYFGAARRMVNSYPDASRSMVLFTSQ